MSDDPFHDLIHEQRGELLAEMPAAQTVVSAGSSGTWYFKWFQEKYPHLVKRHIAFELDDRPDDLPPGIDYHQRSFCDMSNVPDESVGLVFAGQSIEHVSTADAFDFFAHAHRVLAPGGWLVMDSPNFAITDEWPYVNPDHIIEYTPRQMSAIVKAAGFEVGTVKGLLLCRQNGKVIHDPYEFSRIDQRRIRDAKTRPKDSFIWWMEARKTKKFGASRLRKLLDRTNHAYERQVAKTARRKEKVERESAGISRGGFLNRLVRGGRAVIRRVTPYRARWLARVIFKRVTGLYYRDLRAAVDKVDVDIAELRKSITPLHSKLDALEELMGLILRRMRATEDELSSLPLRLEPLQEQLAEIMQRIPPRIIPIREWEPWLDEYVPKHGDLFIDVGASSGQYAASLAPGYHKVFAFEPNPQARDGLKLSTTGVTNVEIDARAVSSRTGMMKLYLFPDHAQTSQSPAHHEAPVGDPIGEFMVPCVRLDDIAFPGKVDFIKIDTEGAEVDVIDGALKTILTHKPRMLVEIHSKENGRVIEAKLQELGYEFSTIRHPAYVPQDHYWEQHYWLSCMTRASVDGLAATADPVSGSRGT